MTRRRSVTQLAIDNLIFRVTHRKKRKLAVNPSDIPSFNYTAHLTDIRWLRQHARRKA